MKIKWSKYIPHKPWGRQLAFLSLPHMEAFYGGAAGGGKSDALLMAALQYADVPGFKGIIFRRTYADMQLPSSILNRAKEWLAPFLASGEVKYRPGDNHTFYFPSGAQIACGYLQNAGDEQRYQGSEYTYIAFDEVTHFYEDQYLYLFSRLRKPDGIEVPLRMRSASNPSGIGMRWVKKRYQIKKEGDIWIGTNPKAPFIPASMLDNPAINAKEYTEALSHLGRVERERLLHGNWDINEDALFEKHWFENSRYHLKSNGFYNIYRPDGTKAYQLNDMFLFSTVDCAASVKTGVKGKSFIKSKPKSSHSVIATWALTPEHDLLWLDNWRFQTTIPELVNRILQNQKRWKPLYNIIEKNGPGEGVYQMGEKAGLPIKPIHTALDKIKNSIAAQLRGERGQIYLPEWAPWLPDLEDELYLWTGDPDEVDDQIDVLSNAANEAMTIAMGREKDSFLRRGIQRAVPYASAGRTTGAYLGLKQKGLWGGGDKRNPLLW